MATPALLSEAEWAAAARRSLALEDGVSLQLESASAAPAADADVTGFIGETLPVRVSVRVGGDGPGGYSKEIAMFLKVVPRANAARERMAVSSRSFVKECGLYEHVFPLMEAALARVRGDVTDDAAAHWGPRCLLTRPDLLLMEDLQAQGFQAMSNRHKLDRKHCAVALEALAAFHAASFALEEQQGPASAPFQERFHDYLQENMFTDAFPSLMWTFVITSVPGLKRLVGFIPKYRDSPRYQEILRKIDQIPAISIEMVKASSKFHNVICHGDMWVGNVLFRYLPSGEVSSARLVDFQIVRYCPPALDIASFLFLSTNRSFREEHTSSQLGLYHAALKRALPTADTLVSLSDLRASYQEYASFGRVIAACYLPADLISRDVLRDLVATEEDYESYISGDRSAVFEEQWRRDEEYRESVQEVLEDLIDGFILNPAEAHHFKL